MSRPRNTNWKKDARRRKKFRPKEAVRANAEYDKIHGSARIIASGPGIPSTANHGKRGPVQTRNIGSAGTQAPYPSRPEHATTPPWIEVPGDPPLPRISPQSTVPEAPRQRRFNFAGPRAPEWMSGPLGAAAQKEGS